MKKNPKNSSKNSKLKEKTQNSRKKLKVREDFSAPERPSDVIKKKPDLQNTSDLSYDILARSYGHLKGKFAIFKDHTLINFLRFRGLSRVKFKYFAAVKFEGYASHRLLSIFVHKSVANIIKTQSRWR